MVVRALKGSKTADNTWLLPALAGARFGVSGRTSIGAGRVHAVSIVAELGEVVEAGSAAFVR